MQETQVRFLGQEDPLEEGIATNSSNSWPGESLGRRSLAGYGLQGSKESDRTEVMQHACKHILATEQYCELKVFLECLAIPVDVFLVMNYIQKLRREQHPNLSIHDNHTQINRLINSNYNENTTTVQWSRLHSLFSKIQAQKFL